MRLIASLLVVAGATLSAQTIYTVAELKHRRQVQMASLEKDTANFWYLIKESKEVTSTRELLLKVPDTRKLESQSKHAWLNEYQRRLVKEINNVGELMSLRRGLIKAYDEQIALLNSPETRLSQEALSFNRASGDFPPAATTARTLGVGAARAAAGGAIGGFGAALGGIGVTFSSSRTASPQQDTPGYHAPGHTSGSGGGAASGGSSSSGGSHGGAAAGGPGTGRDNIR